METQSLSFLQDLKIIEKDFFNHFKTGTRYDEEKKTFLYLRVKWSYFFERILPPKMFQQFFAACRDHFEFVPNDVFSQRNKSRVVQNEASFGSLEN